MVDILIKNRFLEFVKNESVAVISTVSAQNQPMSATIYFSVDIDLNFYFMTKSFTRKYKNIENNNQVSLVVGTENVPVTAQIQGSAVKLVDEGEIKVRLAELKKVIDKNKFIGPLFEIVANENADHNEIILFKIKPSWIRWLDLREGAEKNEFIQILP